MATFAVNLTEAQVARLRGAVPEATVADWQEWIKRQLKAEVLKRGRMAAEEDKGAVIAAAVTQLEQELEAEGW